MLCYRFMATNKVGNYMKFYDSEVIPILLKQPASCLATTITYGNQRNSSHTVTSNVFAQQSKNYFIRQNQFLFRDLHLGRPVSAAPSNKENKPDNVPKSDAEAKETADPVEEPKLTLVQRFKKMYKEYWYVLLPVHVITSSVWLGGFYYLSRSGVDIATAMESLHFNETICDHLRNSHMGHVAIAYFLYKIFTPFRYMLTLGGTTLSIKYLSRLGYIKPVPSKNALMKMYQDKKSAAQESIRKKTSNSNEH